MTSPLFANRLYMLISIGKPSQEVSTFGYQGMLIAMLFMTPFSQLLSLF